MRLVQEGKKVGSHAVSERGTQFMNAGVNKLLAAASESEQVNQQLENTEFKVQYKKAAKAAEEQAGIDAHEAVGQGFVFEGKDDDTVYAQQYNKTAKATALMNAGNKISTITAQLAAENADDPQAFQDALHDHIESFTAEQGMSKQQKTEISTYVVKAAKPYLPSMVQKGFQKERNKLIQVSNATLQVHSNLALQHMYDGNEGAFTEVTTQLNSDLDHMVKEGYMSAPDAAQQVIKYNQSANTQEVLGKVDRALQNTSFSEATEEVGTWYDSTAQQGMFTPKELNKQRDAMLNQIGKANKAWLKAQSEEIKAASAQLLFDGSEILDYKNKVDVKAAESVYNTLADTNIANPATREAGLQLVASKSIIPTTMLSSIRKNSKSANPDNVLAAVNVIMQIKDKRSDALVQLPEAQVALAYKVNDLIEDGIDPVEAIAESREFFRQPAQEHLANVKAEYKSNAKYTEEVSDRYDHYVDANLDPDWFSNPANVNAARGDFSKLVEHYIGITGDMDTAVKMTGDKLKSVYGVSYDTEGNARVEKYAPNKILTGSDDESDWVKQSWGDAAYNAVETLAKRGVTAKPSEIVYQPSAETLQGDKVWRLYYTNHQGILEPVANSSRGYWKPNKLNTEAGKAEEYDKDMIRLAETNRLAELGLTYQENVRMLKEREERRMNDDGKSLIEAQGGYVDTPDDQQ